MTRFRFAGLLVLLAVFTLGFTKCEPEETKYLLSQAPGQLALIMDRVPFDRMLKDPNLDPAVRAKLEFVLDVKKYGVEKIGLVRNKNYEVFVQVNRDSVNYNLTAAPPLSMKPLTWRFPLVGDAPYLGFFSREDADKKAAELKAKGNDVYVRTAGAYSMLGIMADPLYSPLLTMRDEDMANLVIHEMTHGTVFIKGQMSFNENLALFVGNQGSYEYLVQRYGADSEQAKYALGSNEDDNTFSIEIMALSKQLEDLYASNLSDDEKLKRKAEIIAAHKRHFREDVLPKMKTDGYARWPDKDINNATIISRTTYFHDLALYDQIYAAHNHDLKATVDFWKGVAQHKDVNAEQYARDWLQNHGGPAGGR